MRSNAPESPCWARRMASASVISLVSVGLARVTVPNGTHPSCGMHPYLLELHSFAIDCVELLPLACSARLPMPLGQPDSFVGLSPYSLIISNQRMIPVRF